VSETASGEGGCLCGAVRFRVIGDPLITMACHCRGCQRLTASAYSVSAFYPADRFEVLVGTPVAGALRGPQRHLYCPSCMSWMFTRPEGMDDFVNVRSTLLDAPVFDTPFIETVTAEALPWARINAVHAFEGFPPRERFPGLIGEFLMNRGAGTSAGARA
jgi:hypothetical protein